MMYVSNLKGVVHSRLKSVSSILNEKYPRRDACDKYINIVIFFSFKIYYLQYNLKNHVYLQAYYYWTIMKWKRKNLLVDLSKKFPLWHKLGLGKWKVIDLSFFDSIFKIWGGLRNLSPPPHFCRFVSWYVKLMTNRHCYTHFSKKIHAHAYLIWFQNCRKSSQRYIGSIGIVLYGAATHKLYSI